MEFFTGMNEILVEQQFSVPLGQIFLLLILSFTCLLYGKHKLGLLATFLFVFYWGFISQRPYWSGMFGETSSGTVFYLFLTSGLGVTGFLSYFQKKKTHTF